MNEHVCPNCGGQLVHKGINTYYSVGRNIEVEETKCLKCGTITKIPFYKKTPTIGEETDLPI